MGLFNLFKNKASGSPDRLPDNDQELEALYEKHVYNKNDKSKKLCESIILKAYDLCADKNDLSHWAVRKHCLLYGTQEELEKFYNYEGKRSFDEYVNKFDSFILSSSLSGEELLEKCPIFLSIDGSDNRFIYNENPQNYLDYRTNAIFNYYNDHLTYLMKKVIELLEKQIENNSICLSGFYMYKDLEQFLTFETKDYNNGIFEQAHEYTNNLRYYLQNKYANIKKGSTHQEKSLKYESMHKYALNELKTFDSHVLYNTLLKKYHTYLAVRDLIKTNSIILRVVEIDYTKKAYYVEKVKGDFDKDCSFTLLRTGKNYTFEGEYFGVHGKTKVLGENKYGLSMSDNYDLYVGDIFYSWY